MAETGERISGYATNWPTYVPIVCVHMYHLTLTVVSYTPQVCVEIK